MKIEWRITKSFWISLLIAAILIMNVTLSGDRVKAHAAGINWYGPTGIHQMGGFFLTFPFVVQQYAAIKYDSGIIHVRPDGSWYYVERPRIWMTGSYENPRVISMVDTHVDWHGIYRVNSHSIDVGINFTQTVKLGIDVAQRSCWIRTRFTIPWGGAGLRIGATRQGC